MATDSLTTALVSNTTVTIMKFVVGILTGSTTMIAEGAHSIADIINQLLLRRGKKRSKIAPDLSHPFGYSKSQFFWAFIVGMLIFSIAGLWAFFRGINILLSPEEHVLDQNLFVWNLVVLALAIVLESYALYTAFYEVRAFKEKYKSRSIAEAISEMQDPVNLSLLTEDSLALFTLIIAMIGTSITYVTKESIYDGITTIVIGVVLMIGGGLLAIENKEYLIGKAVSKRFQDEIREIVESHEGVESIQLMRTMLLGANDMILTLDLVFTPEAEKGDIAELIDHIEEELSSKIEKLSKDKIFIEAQ